VSKITPDLIREIHRSAIDGGGKDEEQSLKDTVRDEGCIPMICYGGKFLSNPYEKAAYYLHRIATRHPFMEGNKRTAFMVAAITIYTDTEFMIENDATENNRFVRLIASGEVEEEEIVKWFDKHLIRSEI
jgi:death on curing protein